MVAKPKAPRTADDMAAQQRDISVSEFFVKNRHLLGFDGPIRALLTTVKEGVDNALDACEEAGILPEIHVSIRRAGEARPVPTQTVSAGVAAAATSDPTRTTSGDTPGAIPTGLFQRNLFQEEIAQEEAAAQAADESRKEKKSGRKITDPPERLVVSIEDNGPGIVEEQIGKVFGKLLYGSKFHRLRQSLTADQPVIVERAGRVERAAIGDLVDGCLREGEELADVTELGLRVPAFDRKTGRYAWRTVSHVIRHPRANEVLRIRTEGGRSVKVTGCHSLFTFDPKSLRVVEVEARKLHAGDHVVAPKRIPAAARVTQVSGEAGSTHELTPALLRLLGLYAARGECDGSDVTLSVQTTESRLRAEVEIAGALGVTLTVESKDADHRVTRLSDCELTRLLPLWVGRTAASRRVPWFVFGASSEQRRCFLDALHMSQESVDPSRRGLVLTTASTRLRDDVELLWRMLGVVASRSGSSGCWRVEATPSNAAATIVSRAANRDGWSRHADLRAQGPTTYQPAGVERALGAHDTQVASIAQVQSSVIVEDELAASDLCLLRVEAVEAVEDANEFVYDLSVPGCENFVAGDGLLACHNSRGQQGIGISAAGMYGQLTTGKPVLITSKTHAKKKAHYMEVTLDLQRNQPEIRMHEERDWKEKGTGTLVEIELEAKYQKGVRSVDTYIRATALANPHVTLVYRDLDGNEVRFDRATKKLPEEAREVQPHPYGVELGMLLQMLKTTQNRQLGAFLENEFSRVSKKASDEICTLANLNRQTWVARVAREEAAALHTALGKVKLMNPPTDCISPIGEGLLIDSLAREYPQAFIRAVTRSPAVYRGNPFQIEVAIAYGGGIPADQPANLLRFANRVPLLYQQGACLITKAVQGVPWKKYGLEQPRGSLPAGPVVIVAHLASVWVPFTSESKEAVAHYDEIHAELRFALMQLGRMLKEHVSKTRRVADEMKKREYISKYIPKISEALQQILEFDDKERDRTTAKLTEVLNRRTI